MNRSTVLRAVASWKYRACGREPLIQNQLLEHKTRRAKVAVLILAGKSQVAADRRGALMLDEPHWVRLSRRKTQQEIALFASCHFGPDAISICTEGIPALHGTIDAIHFQTRSPNDSGFRPECCLRVLSIDHSSGQTMCETGY